MESLKTLKVIGVVALLCLIGYLAIPDGRLNTLDTLRTLGIPKVTSKNKYQGEFAKFFELGSDLMIDFSDPTSTEINRRLAYCDKAIESGKADLIGIASRNAGLFSSTTNFEPHQRRTITTLTEKLIALNLLGQKLAPDNAFFPLQLAACYTVLDDQKKVREYLIVASHCNTFTDYAIQESQLEIASLNYQPSTFERTQILSSVMFKNLSPTKMMVKEMVGKASPDQNLDDRITSIKIGRLLTNSDETLITQLVGKSIITLSLSQATSDEYKPKRYRAEYWKNLLANSSNETKAFFQSAQAVSNAPVDRPYEDPNIDWNHIYTVGPLIARLPIAVFILFFFLVVLMLNVQKIASRPWIKSIRYLALVPLSIVLAQNQSSFMFHIPTVITILAVSIPIALISYTEKFVPVIHLTIVGISVFYFERNSALTEVLFHVLIMAALVLLAWKKNRDPDSKLSQNLSALLVLGIVIILGMWTPGPLSGQTDIAPLPLVVILTCASTLAIVDADRQRARMQATIAASLGLAIFAATAIYGLKITHTFSQLYVNEPQFVKEQASKFISLFPTETANNISGKRIVK